MTHSTPNKRPPVEVELTVSGFGGSETEVIEFDRDEWDRMTPAERAADIARQAEDFAMNYVNWGWHIRNEADLAAVQPESEAT